MEFFNHPITRSVLSNPISNLDVSHIVYKSKIISKNNITGMFPGAKRDIRIQSLPSLCMASYLHKLRC